MAKGKEAGKVGKGARVKGKELNNGDVVYWKHTSDFNVGSVDASLNLTYVTHPNQIIELVHTDTICHGDSYSYRSFVFNSLDYPEIDSTYQFSQTISVNFGADTTHVLNLFVGTAHNITETFSNHADDLLNPFGDMLYEPGTPHGHEQ